MTNQKTDLSDITLNKPSIRLGEVHFPEPPHGGYTYRLPNSIFSAKEGSRVRVPFGHTSRVGFLVKVYLGPDDDKFKNISHLIDDVPMFSPELLSLTEWTANYYLCDWGEVLLAAMPSGLKPRNLATYKLSDEGLLETLAGEGSSLTAQLWRRLKEKPLSLKKIRTEFDSGEESLRKLQHRGWIETVVSDAPRIAPRMDILYEWTEEVSYEAAMQDLRKNATKMHSALKLLEENEGRLSGAFLSKTSKGMHPTMRTFLERGWLEAKEIPFLYEDALEQGLTETSTGSAELTDDQVRVINSLTEALKEENPKTFLLHGVTGSGKTMVYLEIVEAVLAQGKTAIMMAPEISLTPQLTGRFYRRFGDLVALSHSRMSSAERREIWLKAKSGQARVIIGPRSVIFSPVENLGVIIVDEEHEESYKQVDPAPRYNARDVGIYRARKCGAVSLVGSATPDVASYFNAKVGRYRLIELTNRYSGIELPPVWVVKWGIGKEGSLFCPKLLKKIEERLELNQQTIILINRRAFSTSIYCPDCGDIAECPNCDISLKYHSTGQKLECHYCGFSEAVYDLCPKCNGKRLRFKGLGSQRVEKELNRLFPQARIARMDQDTTRRKGSHRDLLEQFAQRKQDILLGTKMVAKGHDFPGVTLVGILMADAEWHMPDFRAQERAFRLYVQASGRAGRSSAGEVVIQSWEPQESVLRWIQQHDFGSLFNAEIGSRKSLQYPPFSKLLTILVKGLEPELVEEAAQSLRQQLDEKLQVSIILGPAPPLIERVENTFRRRILLKLPQRVTTPVREEKKRIRKIVDKFRKKMRKDKVSFVIDVDPVEV
ncbi:MAG: primosomal protein N' [Calditrichaeota bacterium]|nr:primosomal protein N' [Calditrichota bacterium]MBT7616601.1 primosomal protein N' [Calditrichota bacterium]MBT7788285.1 primosomal protein N' [Calditrichota bacterium]